MDDNRSPYPAPPSLPRMLRLHEKFVFTSELITQVRNFSYTSFFCYDLI